jgi:integrase
VRTALIRDVLTPLKAKFPSPAAADGFADGRLHSFRHYYCSSCAVGRTPQQIVMDWLGHRESRMVRHYFHLHDEEARRQMRRLNFLGGGPGGVAGPGGGG